MPEKFSINLDTVFGSLDGDVQSQGVKLSHREWLDPGCEDYAKTPDNVKAAAYQAAKVCGWDDDQLSSLMLQHYRHLDDQVMGLSIKTLQSLAEKHPLPVEEVYDPEEMVNQKVKAEPGTLGS